MKNYTDLMKLGTFEERIEYLKLSGIVGKETFGYERYLNQQFYISSQWKQTRDKVIIRDRGCDLGIPDYDINTVLFVHHIEPVSVDDIINDDPKLHDLNNLISTSKYTHDFIHYGRGAYINPMIKRTPNDQVPWR